MGNNKNISKLVSKLAAISIISIASITTSVSALACGGGSCGTSCGGYYTYCYQYHAYRHPHFWRCGCSCYYRCGYYTCHKVYHPCCVRTSCCGGCGGGGLLGGWFGW